MQNVEQHSQEKVLLIKWNKVEVGDKTKQLMTAKNMNELQI